MSVHPAQKYQQFDPSKGKFWGYLLHEELKRRYLIASSFINDDETVIEVGGYSDNMIRNYVDNEVITFSLDMESEGVINDYIQNWMIHINDVDVVVILGCEVVGDLDPVYNLLDSSNKIIIEGWDGENRIKDSYFHILNFMDDNKNFIPIADIKLNFDKLITDDILKDTFISDYRHLDDNPWEKRRMVVWQKRY